MNPMFYWYIVMALIVFFVSIYPMLMKSNKDRDEITKDSLVGAMARNSPNKFERFMTANFGKHSGWTDVKMIWTVLAMFAFTIGMTGAVLNVDWIIKAGAIDFVFILVLLFIPYTLAKIVKMYRYRRIAKELGCDVSDVGWLIRKHGLK